MSQTQARKVPREQCTYEGGSYLLDPKTGELVENKPKAKRKKVKSDADQE